MFIMLIIIICILGQINIFYIDILYIDKLFLAEAYYKLFSFFLL